MSKETTLPRDVANRFIFSPQAISPKLPGVELKSCPQLHKIFRLLNNASLFFFFASSFAGLSKTNICDCDEVKKMTNKKRKNKE